MNASESNGPGHGDEGRVERRADAVSGAAGGEHDAAGFPAVEFVKGGVVGGGGGHDGVEESGAVGGAVVGGLGGEEVGYCGVGFECFA